jgi:Mn-containing catalase
MEKKPEATKSILWDIYISIGAEELGHVGMLVGTVEAASEHEAIEKAPARLKQYGRKLMAVRHSSRGFPASLEGK